MPQCGLGLWDSLWSPIYCILLFGKVSIIPLAGRFINSFTMDPTIQSCLSCCGGYLPPGLQVNYLDVGLPSTFSWPWQSETWPRPVTKYPCVCVCLCVSGGCDVRSGVKGRPSEQQRLQWDGETFPNGHSGAGWESIYIFFILLSLFPILSSCLCGLPTGQHLNSSFIMCDEWLNMNVSRWSKVALPSALSAAEFGKLGCRQFAAK